MTEGTDTGYADWTEKRLGSEIFLAGFLEGRRVRGMLKIC